MRGTPHSSVTRRKRHMAPSLREDVRVDARVSPGRIGPSSESRRGGEDMREAWDMPLFYALRETAPD